METYTLILSKLNLYIEYLVALKVSLEGTSVMLFLTIALYLIILFIFLQILQVILLIIFRADTAAPYSRRKEGGKKILIVGDSTAVGTGAQSYEYSISGLLAKGFPRADILNLGVNGSRTQGVLSQLDLVNNQTFDLIIIITGGNDVWALTSYWGLRKTLRKIFSLANKLSNNSVVVLFFGNDGSANFVPPLFRGAFLNRTKKIQNVFAKVTAEENIPFVELFTSNKNNPFLDDPNTYFAVDGMHPSDLGYWVWYKKMWEIIVEKKMPILKALQE